MELRLKAVPKLSKEAVIQVSELLKTELLSATKLIALLLGFVPHKNRNVIMKQVPDSTIKDIIQDVSKQIPTYGEWLAQAKKESLKIADSESRS